MTELLNIDGKTVGIVSLYADGRDEPSCLCVGCGIYGEGGKWTGETLNGNIPHKALLKWGIKRGFLKFSKTR